MVRRRPAASEHCTGPRILVLSRDPFVRELLRLALAAEGHQVAVVLEVTEAIEAVESGDLSFAFIDVLPPQTAAYFRETVRAVCPTLPIALIAESHASRSTAYFPNVVAHLEKPLGIDEVLAVVAIHSSRKGP